jgi:hypothetical protein
MFHVQDNKLHAIYIYMLYSYIAPETIDIFAALCNH